MARNRDLGKIPFETLGGTAGQLLSKATGTDYDFQWIDNYTSDVEHDVKAGQAVTKGNAVYISSADGTNMIVTKADYSVEGTSSKTIGLMKQSLSLNGIGRVITEGLLAGTGSDPLNTLAGNAGDPVWLGANGNLLFGVANKPYAPLHMVFIGIVTRSHAINGEIFVKVQNGFELQELHNVSAQSPSNRNGLFYNVSTNLWEARAIDSADLPTGDFTEDVSDVFILSGNFKAIIGEGLTIEMKKANSTTNGYLTYSDWIFFNSKQQPLSGTGIVKSTLGTISYLTDNSTNWDTAYSDRMKWDGGATGLDVGTARSSLGLTAWATTAYPANSSGILRNNGSGILSWQVQSFGTGLTDTAGTISVNLSVGIAGGQSVIGGNASSNNLTLSSTSNATKGKILFGTSALSAYDEATNRLGIGTASPSYPVHFSLPVLNTGEIAFYLTSSIAAASTGVRTMVQFDLTGAGTNTSNIYAFNVNLLAGYTGVSATQSGRFVNSSAGTGTNLFSGAVNQGISGIANGTTTGTNVGMGGSASGGATNVGNRSIADSNVANSTNIGMFGLANNTGTGTVYEIGGYFGLNTATPTFGASAALMCDNSTKAFDVFVARVNGTKKWSIASGGNTVWADGVNMVFGAGGAGTQIGGSGNKLAFYGATAIAQQSTSLVTSIAFVANTGTAINSASTFGGYTIIQVIQALKNLGIIA